MNISSEKHCSNHSHPTLRQYFPKIPSKKEIVSNIRKNPSLSLLFDSWNESWQQQFLDLCSGTRGAKLLYDSFFKEIMDPVNHPHRLEKFLSLLLDQNIKICQVLPLDSPRLAGERSLLTMDILVELESGSLANIEVQKVPYLFPGQRCACYSSDLVLRQYKRLRDQAKSEKRTFTYQDIKTVYTIVLFEKSTSQIRAFSQNYIHRFSQISDTGLTIELLQKYIFISLDILQEIVQNKGVTNDLEAWLTLFSSDDPEMILNLCTHHPEFISIYEDVFEICKNMEGVMRMFSKELLELDRNTVDFMIDEMQRDIDRLKTEIEEDKIIISAYKIKSTEKDNALAEKDRLLTEKDQVLVEKDQVLAEKDQVLAEKNNSLAAKDAEIQRLKELLSRISQ